jgi:hypothetical protein
MRARSASHHDRDDSGAFDETPQLTRAERVPASEGMAMSESAPPSVTAGLRATLGRRWNWAWEVLPGDESGGEPRGERGAWIRGEAGRSLDDRSAGVGVRWSLGLPCVELDLERLPEPVPLAGALSAGVSLGVNEALDVLDVVVVLDTLARVAAVAYPLASSELMGGVGFGLSVLELAFEGERRSDEGLRGLECDGVILSWLPLRLRLPPLDPLAGTMYARPVTRNWTRVGRSQEISTRESAANWDALGMRRSVVLRRRPEGENARWTTERTRGAPSCTVASEYTVERGFWDSSLSRSWSHSGRGLEMDWWWRWGMVLGRCGMVVGGVGGWVEGRCGGS